ncbi:MAG TPA: SMP-30/gluconolactonase/LRE family protein [Polyangiaceae bacterium]|nr:SMP-30/gluconolactonase/LRE family protein [Polyangiaceae bacterium]
MKRTHLSIALGAATISVSFTGCGENSNSPTMGTGGSSAGAHQNTGGARSSGGTLSSGGSLSSGGALATGGSTASGGTPFGGGTSSNGGALQSGGSAAVGGTGTAGSAGNSNPGGSSSGGSVNGGTSTTQGGATAGASSGGTAGGGTAGSNTGTPHGSAAKFICPSGKSYGDPLSGMGQVSQFGPPASDYFAFIEGPVWIEKVGALFFSDNASSPSERIFKLVPPATATAVFVKSSSSNGLAVDNEDQIVATDQDKKQIIRFDSSSGMPLGKAISTGSAKPNDVLVRSDDNIYFTDPDSGFYRISPSGQLSAAMKPMQGSRPNGIELSLDENTLYVGDVGNKTISQYTVAVDGSVDTASLKPFVAETKNGTVDGMCVDCAGNVYAGTSNGVEVYSPTGMYLGTVPTGESSNCTFGGPDRKTLYVTSRSVLKAVTLAVPGLPD